MDGLDDAMGIVVVIELLDDISSKGARRGTTINTMPRVITPAHLMTCDLPPPVLSTRRTFPLAAVFSKMKESTYSWFGWSCGPHLNREIEFTLSRMIWDGEYLANPVEEYGFEAAAAAGAP
jgi:hypothetical protein